VTDEIELRHRRQHLLLALVLAGLTGDETFGQLLDAIDDYVAAAVRAALREAALPRTRRKTP
jgi:hypothetical protein